MFDPEIFSYDQYTVEMVIKNAMEVFIEHYLIIRYLKGKCNKLKQMKHSDMFFSIKTEVSPLVVKGTQLASQL